MTAKIIPYRHKDKNTEAQRYIGMSILNEKVTPERAGYYYELLLVAALCILSAFLFWRFVLAPLYTSYIPNYMLIAVLFSVMTFVCCFLEGLVEHFRRRIFPKHGRLGISRVLLFALLGGLIIGILSGVLEFIYEIDPKADKTVKETDQVVFVLDDSASMLESDPDYIRVKSVKEILNDTTTFKKAGLIRFSSEVSVDIPVDMLDDRQKNLIQENLFEKSGSDTQIGDALAAALEDYENDASSDAGDIRTILLLTDGKSSSFDVDSLIDRTNRDKIQINAIALGFGADMRLLKQLTGETGGRLCRVPNARYLKTAYKMLSGMNIKRCLLVPIIIFSSNRGWLRVEQVLFMIIIGFAICTVITAMLKYHPYIDDHARKSPVIIVLASLLLMILNANIFSVYVLLACFLLPLYSGRILEKKEVQKVKKVKPHKIQDIRFARGLPYGYKIPYETEAEYVRKNY